MADYLLVRDSDDLIMSWATTTMSQTGARIVDVDSQDISGDQVSTNRSLMVGGVLTDAFLYTAPILIDWANRVRAWNEATIDWLDNGTMQSDVKWKRCVQIGSKNGMDSDCWTDIIIEYPIS